jgi:benzoate membrane transport protein
MFAGTGILSMICSVAGGVPVNMAAITAAMCASEDAHPEPRKRYWAAIVGGTGYIALGLIAGAIIAFVSLAPPILLQAVAGLGLIGAFSNAAFAAYREPDTREAAAVTFLVTASGLSFAGISGAFWGLVAGGFMMALKTALQPAKA